MTLTIPSRLVEEIRQYEVIPPIDTRTCVKDTTRFPFRFICNLSTQGSGFCTGTLIGPRTVLTAGHCIVDGVPASDIEVTPGRRGGAKPPFGSTMAAGTQPASGYVECSATDYGVVILRDPIGNRTGWWTFDDHTWTGQTVGQRVMRPTPARGGSLPAGLNVHVAGYPADLPAPKHLGGRPDPCFRRGTRKGSVQYHDSNTPVAINPRGILEYLNDTFGGMSGSPVWVEPPPGRTSRVLLAVHISGDGCDPAAPLANRGVFIRGAFRDFARAHSFSPPGTTPPRRPVATYGAKGPHVVELQYRLNVWIVTAPSAGMPRLKVDGILGPKTRGGVKGFQRAMALVVDGIVGPKTWSRLQLPF
jgi:V8-like Glu-specific endopeptidase